MQTVNKAHFLEDFADTLNALKGTLVEISKAPAGTSAFNNALYFEQLSAPKLDHFLQLEQNLGFLTGVDPDELDKAHQSANLGPLRLGVQTARKASNSMISRRNIISLEIDFKTAIPGFLELSPEEKKIIVVGVFQTHHPEIKKQFGDIWIACFSGNSLHIHLKLRAPLECSDSARFSRNYEALVDRFEVIFQNQYQFDRQCKNPARLMRLPFSKNLKVKDSPIQTEVLYHNPNSDSSHAISTLWELADVQNHQHQQSEQAWLAFRGSKDHKDALRNRLTFQAILQHFGYQKFATLKVLPNGETLISSPWTQDATPSCYLNEIKKVFKDFSSGKAGDIFNFLAENAFLNIKTQFKEVIALAEQITGIKPPMNNIRVLTAQGQGQRQKKPQASFWDYCSFFDEHLPAASRDILTGRLMCKLESQWTSATNRIPILKSHALETENLKRAHVEDHLARYAETKEKRLLLHLPEWDGVDRIQKIAQAVKVKNVSQETFEELLKDWGSGIFKRLNQENFQNHLVVLKGGQGIGKDHLIDALVAGLDSYFVDLSITENDRDNYTLLSSTLVGRISEFDRTSKVAAATIKALVTGKKMSFIQKYQTDPTEYRPKCSLIASCNVDQILRDHTGNRRFYVFEIEKIDWTYPDTDSLQILAQFKKLAEENYRPRKESQQEMHCYIQGQTPDDPNQLVLDAFDSRVEEFEIGNQLSPGEKIRFAQIQHLLFQLAKDFGLKIKDVQTLLKTTGRSGRDKKAARYWRIIAPE